MGHRISWAAAILSCGILLGTMVGLAGCGSQPTDQTTVTQSYTMTSLAVTTSTPPSASSTTSVPTTAPAPSTTAAPTTTTQQSTAVEYRNTDYGFTFSLPESWKGYSMVSLQWEAFPNNTNGAGSGDQPVYGPEILIRHPKWTSADPRQDIPIMVFTLAEWGQVQQETLTVGAAPIPPTELGRNARYVFALPARYNYAFPTGYQEVEKILEGKPLKAF